MQGRTEISIKTSDGFFTRLSEDLKKNKLVYLLALPVVLYYVIFHYVPMYGATIAFKDFTPAMGILGSPWIGFDYFVDFFTSQSFFRVVKNTLVINGANLLFGFPAPIFFAVLLNEIRLAKFKRTVQTITYMPHFVSLVVICGIIKNFTNETGIITEVLSWFGMPKTNLLDVAEYFVPIYVISSIWQELGWNSIIYIAAIAAIDPTLYEAASIDGAGRWRKMWHITLAGIMPTIMVLLVLKIGGMMTVGYEKIILLYQPLIYETSDVISTYVYRKGLLELNWGYSSAVGLFNSVINCILLVTANQVTRKFNGSALW